MRLEGELSKNGQGASRNGGGPSQQSLACGVCRDGRWLLSCRRWQQGASYACEKADLGTSLLSSVATLKPTAKLSLSSENRAWVPELTVAVGCLDAVRTEWVAPAAPSPRPGERATMALGKRAAKRGNAPERQRT